MPIFSAFATPAARFDWNR